MLGGGSALDFRLLCNLQGCCQNATEMAKHFSQIAAHGGVEEQTMPSCIAAAVMSLSTAKFAGSPSSCLVKTVDIQSVPGQE